MSGRETHEVLRLCLYTGATLILVAALLERAGGAVSAAGVAIGAVYALVGVGFYAQLVHALLARAWSPFLLVAMTLKAASLAALFLVCWRAPSPVVASIAAGTLSFIPAAFIFARRRERGEGRAPPPSA